MQSLLCYLCYTVFAMHSSLQPLLCNRCYAIFAMHSLLCTFCNVIFATGLPWGSRIIRNKCLFWGHLLRSALGLPGLYGATWGYMGRLCNLCNATFAMQSLLCNLCYAIFDILSVLYNLCNATFAMQSLLCNLCYAIFAMQSLHSTLCNWGYLGVAEPSCRTRTELNAENVAGLLGASWGYF
jgi:hypothetical protein